MQITSTKPGFLNLWGEKVMATIWATCCILALLVLNSHSLYAQVSTDITITPVTTPTLTACSGQGTFVVRVANTSGAAISSLVFRDSMPAGINYVAGSVSGTGVTFGSTVIADRVVTFNIASIPANDFVDVSFTVAANCAVSTVAANIINTYRVSWGSNFTAPFVTPTYNILFPSLSITPSDANFTGLCLTPFVREITICNGGFGSLDSLVLSDVESNTSLIIVNFDKGTVTGAGTNNARTVLHAVDFMTIGNGDGKLDQNECIIVYDTLQIVGSTSPIMGTIRVDWGCNAVNCTNGTPNNVYLVNTSIDGNSQAPALTRTTYNTGLVDSSEDIYNRLGTFREVIKNNSTVTANNASVYYITTGLKYIDTSSIRVSRNGGAPYAPMFSLYNTGQTARSHPQGQMVSVIAPAVYTGYHAPNSIVVMLGDINPGDSIEVTFSTLTTGPVTRVNDACCGNNTGTNAFCGSFYRFIDGPSLGMPVDASLRWEGCPAGNYVLCRENFPGRIFNGFDTVAAPSAVNPLFLARFRSYGFQDSTNLDGSRCAYGDLDTIRLRMTAGVMDLPFYSDRSKFFIRIKTNGGVKWDGDLAATFGRLSSWTGVPWQADHVVDKTAIDSTIEVHFKRSNLPAVAATNFNNNLYKSYQGGAWELVIHVVNTCPGPAQKRLFMTRVYTIDTTTTEPAIESGTDDFPASFTWNSNCPAPCADGVQILNYDHRRTTFGQPDNNGDGIADASGSLNMNVVATNLITWGDTFQLKYKMVVKTTQAGGVPYLYLNSSINYADINAAIICNNFLKKDMPIVTLRRAGGGTFSGVGSSTPVNTANNYLVNLSLQGAGGVSIPGVTAYQDGDTLDVVENLVYWTPHQGYGLTTWSFLHVPYTALVPAPTLPQRFRCDSVVCNFRTIDMAINRTAENIGGNAACSDTMVMRYIFNDQTVSAACGATFFPGEARNVLAPTFMKMVIPAASRWSVTSIRYTERSNIITCGYAVTDQFVPTSLYYYSGDTLMLDVKRISRHFGSDITVNNLLPQAWFYFHFKYTPLPTEAGCIKDHTTPQSLFITPLKFETTRPVDSTTIRNVISNAGNGIYVGNAGAVFLRWPGTNNNNVNLYAGNIATVTKPNVIVPVRYTKGSSSVYGFDFMGIPNRPGIVVDSVVDKTTGLKVVSVPGSAIYQVGYMAPNTTRDFDVYTHIELCQNDSITIYADRTPCSGYPDSWAAYECQSNARKTAFRYVTFQGELQMVDSLYSTLKDICTADTVQFKVINSQTQDATGVKVSFELPLGMSLIPGQTQLRLGNGAYVTVSDPVLNAGTYSWTLPASDTLRRVSLSPENTLYLRSGFTTTCGFVSGSQISSNIAGFVACGPITSLLNTNPPPLNISGLPALSYFTDPQITVDSITSCNLADAYNYRVDLSISGGTTGANDSIKVVLPAVYGYVSYSAAAPGSVNAPAAQPLVTTLPSGATQLAWQAPAGITSGNGITFIFKYKELSSSNKCDLAPSRATWVNTIINSDVFCASLGSACPVGIFNGGDTVIMQSLKPSITTTTSSVVFSSGCNAMGLNCGPNSYLNIAGTLFNNGTADLLPGVDVIMEPFIDLDNSGTVTPGDFAFAPFVYNGGIAMGGNHPYTYNSTINAALCMSCAGKNVLLRFSNTPALPAGASQCLCDSVLVSSVSPTVVYLLSIAGTVFNDGNGLNGNMVDGTGTNAGGLTAILVNSMGLVMANATVMANGTYTFFDVTSGNYRIVLSTVAGTVGQPAPMPSLPSGWGNTGEKLGTGLGSDGTANGNLTGITVVATSLTNANFGINRLPLATPINHVAQVNPGGTNRVVVPTLTGSDPEQGAFPGVGNQDTIKILTLPTNGTLYYNGVPVIVGQVIPNYDPSLLTIDPDDGTLVVEFTFGQVDAAGLVSPAASVMMPFNEVIPMPVSVGDTVFVDNNFNGLQDVNDQGLAGVTVTLYDATTNLVVTTDAYLNPVVPQVTDANGKYRFDSLDVGNYYVVFDVTTAVNGAAYVPTLQNVNANGNDADDSDANASGQSDATGILMNGDSSLTLDAGFYLPVSIGDTVFVDNNYNGLQDVNDQGLAGVRVTLYDALTNLPVTINAYGDPVVPHITDATGKYRFDSLVVCSYYVIVDVTTAVNGANYVPTQQNVNANANEADDSDIDSNGRSDSSGLLTSGQTNFALDAGFYWPVSVGDTVFVDNDFDGLQEATDPGLPGVTVTLYDALTNLPVATNIHGNPILPQVTDATGKYQFDSLVVCSYYVVFDVTTAVNGAAYVATKQNVNGNANDADDSDVDGSGQSDATAVLTSGQTDFTIDAGFYLPVSVGDTAFVDNDFDGLQEATDPGLPGVTVTLYAATADTIVTTNAYGNPVVPQITDANGAYLFDSLAVGSYYVVFDVSTALNGSAYVATIQDVNANANDADDSDASPTTGQTAATPLLTSGQRALALDAGFYLPVSIGDTAFVDIDFDGLQEATDPGLPGVTVTLYNANTNQVVTANAYGDPVVPQVTNANGAYLFDSLAVGSYYVVFDANTAVNGSDYVATIQDVNGNANDADDSDANASGQTAATPLLTSGQRNLNIDAGFYLPVLVGDTAFVDNNFNGLQDINDQGLAGVTVTLYNALTNQAVTANAYGDPVVPQVTDANGRYLFDSLAVGNYYVVFDATTAVNGADYVPTIQNVNGNANDADDSDANGSGQSDATGFLTSDQSNLTIDAGFYLPVSVGDTVFVDNDRDGLQEATNPGLAGVTVTLYDATSDTIVTTNAYGDPVVPQVTDATGKYLFDSLAVGNYYVVFDVTTAVNGPLYSATEPNVGSNDAIDSDADPFTGRTPATGFLTSGQDNLTLDAGFVLCAPLACLTVNIKFGNNCEVLITPEMLLAGTNNYPSAAGFELVIADQSGQPVPGNLITGKYAGMRLRYLIRRTGCTDAFCWGEIIVEDGSRPRIARTSFTPDPIYCFDANFVLNNPKTIGELGVKPSPRQAPAGTIINGIVNDEVLNLGIAEFFFCDPTCKISVKWSDKLEVYGCDSINATGTWGRIYRQWVATNCNGMRSDTVQVIVLKRPPLSAFVFTGAGEKDPATPNYDWTVTYNACTPDKSLIKKVDWMPRINSTFHMLPDLDRRFFLDEVECNYSVQIKDTEFAICGGKGVKIDRELYVFDWCRGGIVDTFHILIKIGDFEAPTLEYAHHAPFDISTGPMDCTAAIPVTVAGIKSQFGVTIKDNCTLGNVSVSVKTKDRYVKGILVAENVWEKVDYAVMNGMMIGLPVGRHRLIIDASDGCYNAKKDSFEFNVSDKIAPVMKCDDDLHVTLSNANGYTSGYAQVSAADIDEGSWDNCKLAWIAVRRNVPDACVASFIAKGYDTNGNGKLDALGADNDYSKADGFDLNGDGDITDFGETFILKGGKLMTPLADFVEFFCCDLTERVTVELWGGDIYGNTNYCWMDLLIEDKVAPTCIAPWDITIDCDDKNLGSIDARIASAAIWGDVTVSTGDDCAALTIEYTTEKKLKCGAGWIDRIWTLTKQTAKGPITITCKQRITIRAIREYNICFPKDANFDCKTPIIDTLIKDELACDLLAVNVSDKRYDASDDECYKIFRTYTVIDWCAYSDVCGDPMAEGSVYVVNRATFENYGKAPLYLLVRDANRDQNEEFYLSKDLVPNNSGDIRFTPPFCTASGEYYHSFMYTQIIKVYDSERPVVTGKRDTFCTSPTACTASVTKVVTIKDNCTDKVELERQYLMIAPFQTTEAGSMILYSTPRWSTKDLGNGQFEITVANLPEGLHDLIVVGRDECGNLSVATRIPFVVKDCKAPAPICINGLSAELMPDGNGGGMMAVWAKDFVASPIYDCNGQGPETKDGLKLITKYSINRVGSPVVSTQTSLNFTCADAGKIILVELHAWDERGNHDFCITYVEVQDNRKICVSNPNLGSISGLITNDELQPVLGVSVEISGGAQLNQTTAATGTYNFANLSKGNDFTIVAQLDKDHLNGVSTLDLVHIQKHILGVKTIDNPYRLIAADVNNSKSVSTLDMILIRKLILGIDAKFASVPSWKFIDAKYHFSAGSNPWAEAFPEVVNVNDLAGDIKADFIAIKMGDVNGNASASGVVATEVRGGNNMLLNTAEQALKAGQSYEVAFRAKDLAQLQGFQFTLQLTDQVTMDGLDYGVMKAENFGVFSTEGLITTSFVRAPLAGAFAGDEILFTLKLKANANVNLSEVLKLNSRRTHIEAYNQHNEVMGVQLNFNSTVINDQAALYQNTPNPFADETSIGFYLPKATRATLTVRDVKGALIYKVEGSYTKGNNRVILKQEQLRASGVLYYTLETSDFTDTKKMVLLNR